MAVYPCDWSVHRYPGPQRSAYVSFAYDNEVQTTKLRFCLNHFGQFMELVHEHLAEIDENSQISKTCEMCDRERSLGVYAKVFDDKAEPVYFAGDFCAEHASLVGLTLKTAAGRRMSSYL